MYVSIFFKNVYFYPVTVSKKKKKKRIDHKAVSSFASFAFSQFSNGDFVRTSEFHFVYILARLLQIIFTFIAISILNDLHPILLHKTHVLCLFLF
jgi:hypothetical protein